MRLRTRALSKALPATHCSGYSLIELMLALAIVSVLLVIATRYYSTTSSAQKVNSAANMLQVVINASEDFKNSTNSYAGITIDKLVDQGLIPQSFSTKTNTNINPWGGTITADAGADNQNFITMTLTHVPKADCKNLTEIMQAKGVRPNPDDQCPQNIYSATYPATSEK